MLDEADTQELGHSNAGGKNIKVKVQEGRGNFNRRTGFAEQKEIRVIKEA